MSCKCPLESPLGHITDLGWLTMANARLAPSGMFEIAILQGSEIPFFFEIVKVSFCIKLLEQSGSRQLANHLGDLFARRKYTISLWGGYRGSLE